MKPSISVMPSRFMIICEIVGATPVSVPSGLRALNGGWLAMPTRTFLLAWRRARRPRPWAEAVRGANKVGAMSAAALKATTRRRVQSRFMMSPSLLNSIPWAHPLRPSFHRRLLGRRVVPVARGAIGDRLVLRRAAGPVAGRHHLDDGVGARPEETWDRVAVAVVCVDHPMLGGEVFVVGPADDDVAGVYQQRVRDDIDRTPVARRHAHGEPGNVALGEEGHHGVVGVWRDAVLAVADLFLWRGMEELQGKVRGDEELVEIVRRELERHRPQRQELAAEGFDRRMIFEQRFFEARQVFRPDVDDGVAFGLRHTESTGAALTVDRELGQEVRLGALDDVHVRAAIVVLLRCRIARLEAPDIEIRDLLFLGLGQGVEALCFGEHALEEPRRHPVALQIEEADGHADLAEPSRHRLAAARLALKIRRNVEGRNLLSRIRG